MRRSFFIVIGVLFIVLSSVEASIQTSSSLIECIEETGLEEGDLLVLDVDLTLIAPTDPALLYPQIKRHKRVLQEIAEWTPLLKMVTLDLIPRRYNSQLVEEGVPRLIEKIRERGIPVIALTACSVHSLGDENLGPRMRYDQLSSHDIQLSDPVLMSSPFELDDLETAMGYYPMYYQGVLVSNTIDRGDDCVVNPKGEVLLSFIKRLPFVPKRVVFIDDRRNNLESVEDALKWVNIEHVGWEYRGGDFLATEDVTQEQFMTVWGGLVAEANTIIDRYFPEQK